MWYIPNGQWTILMKVFFYMFVYKFKMATTMVQCSGINHNEYFHYLLNYSETGDSTVWKTMEFRGLIPSRRIPQSQRK